MFLGVAEERGDMFLLDLVTRLGITETHWGSEMVRETSHD